MAGEMQDDPAPAMTPNNGGLHMLDYSMLWAQDLGRYVEQTGDAATAAELYPALERFIAHLEDYAHPSSGLLDVPRDHWSRTALIDWPATSSRYGQSAALNALYVETLRRAAQTARMAGFPEAAAEWDVQAQKVHASLNAELFLSGEGRYLTHHDGERTYPPGVHAQAWPLAYALPPAGRQAEVANALLELLADDPAQANVSPYGLFWVLEGLGKAGFISEGLDVIRLYYGYMLERGATTWWETFDANRRMDASYSHGWGAAPTWFLTTYVLGLQITGPDRWVMRPALHGVDFASGVAPLGNGRIEVSWERQDCGRFTLNVASPGHTSGEVVLPPDLLPSETGASGGEILLNGTPVMPSGGEPINPAGLREEGLHIYLDGGSHRIESRPAACP
jgi:alpha-L-rhamnosidase